MAMLVTTSTRAFSESDQHDQPFSPIDLFKSPAFEIQRLEIFNHYQAGKQLYQHLYQPHNPQFFPDSVFVYAVQSNPRIYLYTHSPAGNMQSVLIKIMQGSAWLNESLENRSYDALNNLVLQHWQAWNGTNWVNSSRKVYTYDTNQKILTLLEQNWDASTSAWLDFRKTTNTWSVNGLYLTRLQELYINGSWINQFFEFYIWQNNKLVEAQRQIWSNNNWMNQARYLYTYDAEDRLSTMTIMQWSFNEWVDFYRELYAYNSANLLVSSVSQFYNNNWQNDEQYIYAYDPLGFPESIHRQVWQSGLWQNSVRRTYSNNNFGNPQLALHQIWQQNDWLNQFMFVNSFDENGNTTTAEAFVWTNNGWQQSMDHQLEINYNSGLKTLRYQGYRANASYAELAVGNPSATAPSDFRVYPNPSNGIFFIFNDLLKNSSALVIIFGPDGRLLYRSIQPTILPIEVNLTDQQAIKPGIYNLVLIHDSGLERQKILINK